MAHTQTQVQGVINTLTIWGFSNPRFVNNTFKFGCSNIEEHNTDFYSFTYNPEVKLFVPMLPQVVTDTWQLNQLQTEVANVNQLITMLNTELGL